MTLSQPVLDRRGLLPLLFPEPARYLFITGLAGAARDATALTGEADNLFALGGAMGAAVPMGLGLALVVHDREVAVVTGDGELLMNVGALATTASTLPHNLSIVCIDNSTHGETGGQAGHTSRRTNLALMAQGAGLPSVMTLENTAGIEQARRFLEESPGPRFLLVRVLPGPPERVKRNWDAAERRLCFRTALAAGRRADNA